MVKTALKSVLRGLMRTPVWGLKKGFRPILRRLRLFFTNPVCHHIDLLRDQLQASMDNLSHIPREADRLILGFLKMQHDQGRHEQAPWQAVPLGPNRLLVRHPLAGFMYLDPADVYAVPRIILGSYQPGLQQLWPRLVRPGWTILEVGAGQGFHTLSLALLTGPTGRVLTAEANPDFRAVLHDNIAAHRMERIVTILAEPPLHDLAPNLIVCHMEASATLASEVVNSRRNREAETILVFSWAPPEVEVNSVLNRRAFLDALARQGLHIWRIDDQGELLPRQADEWTGDFLAARQEIALP